MSVSIAVSLNSFWLRQQVNRTGDPNRPYGHPDSDTIFVHVALGIISTKQRRLRALQYLDTRFFRNLRSFDLVGVAGPIPADSERRTTHETLPWHLWEGELPEEEDEVLAIVPSVWACYGDNAKFIDFLDSLENQTHEETVNRLVDTLETEGAAHDFPLLVSGVWTGVQVNNSTTGDRPFGSWISARIYREVRGPFPVPVAAGDWRPPTLLLSGRRAQKLISTTETPGVSHEPVSPGEHIGFPHPGLIELRSREPLGSHASFFGGEHSLFFEVRSWLQ